MSHSLKTRRKAEGRRGDTRDLIVEETDEFDEDARFLLENARRLVRIASKARVPHEHIGLGIELL